MTLPRTILVPVALLGLVGCSEWPTWSLKGHGVQVIDPDSPSDNVPEVQWSEATPPYNEEPYTLAALAGYEFRGSIEGAGWSTTEEADTTLGCDEQRYPYSPPGERGFYTGGHHTIELQLDDKFIEPATLCMAIEMKAPEHIEPSEYGYDAVLFELDKCGAPIGLADESMPGYGLGHPAPKPWSYQLKPDVTYVLVLGAYHPVLFDREGKYRVLAAALPGISPTLCPAVLPFAEEG